MTISIQVTIQRLMDGCYDKKKKKTKTKKYRQTESLFKKD